MAIVEDISPDIVTFWGTEGVYEGVKLTSSLVVRWEFFSGMMSSHGGEKQKRNSNCNRH